MPRIFTEIWQQDFLNLNLPDKRFNGVYANAMLFHVPSQELPRVLRELHATLEPRAYGAFYDLETWHRMG